MSLTAEMYIIAVNDALYKKIPLLAFTSWKWKRDTRERNINYADKMASAIYSLYSIIQYKV